MTTTGVSPTLPAGTGHGVQAANGIDMNDSERHGLGFATLAADGAVLDARGSAVSFLPPVGRSCFDSPALIGMEDEFAALRAGRQSIIALPSIGVGGDGKISVTIVWRAEDSRFSIAAARAFGASETENMLVRERRERRLADEQAEAERRRANISEALYRDIVESNADLVLRLTPERRIAFANRRALAFCGATLPAFVGRPVADALRAADGAEWSDVADKAAETSFEQQALDASGAPVWIWWRVAWLGHAGGPQEYQAIGRDITLLRQLRAEVERANIEARSALVMRERLKIAHDLHDTIVHALVAVVAQLRLVRKMAERAPERVSEELARAEEAARAGLDRGRDALGQVRFQLAGVDGLAAALARAVRRFDERTGVPVALAVDPAVASVSGEQAEVLFRIVEEALRNVEAHAQAQRVSVSARADGGDIVIEIADDGRGFDTSADHPGHYGLQGMGEQARMIGGCLIVKSRPGAGVVTTIRAPIRFEE